MWFVCNIIYTIECRVESVLTQRMNMMYIMTNVPICIRVSICDVVRYKMSDKLRTRRDSLFRSVCMGEGGLLLINYGMGLYRMPSILMMSMVGYKVEGKKWNFNRYISYHIFCVNFSFLLNFRLAQQVDERLG